VKIRFNTDGAVLYEMFQVAGLNDGMVSVKPELDSKTSILTYSVPWCREISCKRIWRYANVLAANGVDCTVDIHGIRYDPHNKQYQRSSIKGNIGRTLQSTDDAMRLLFWFDTLALHRLFQTGCEGNVDWYGYLVDMFGVGTTARHNWVESSLDGSSATVGSIGTGIHLNNEVSTGVPRFGTNYYGSITGIPVLWLCSKAATSYLMYLVRLWGNLYADNHSKYLVGQFRGNSLAFGNDVNKHCESTGTGADTLTNKLVATMCGLYGYAFLSSRYAESTFWGFTSLLVHSYYSSMLTEVGAGDYSVQLEKLREAVFDASGVDGFSSWMHKFMASRNSDLAGNATKAITTIMSKNGLSKYITPEKVD